MGDEIVAAVDVDGSGSIDFDEFLIMMVMQLNEENKSASDEEVKEMFRLMDKNGDNFLDWEDLNGALSGVSADPPIEKWEVDAIFNEIDNNGDGVIDVEEFTNWLTHQISTRQRSILLTIPEQTYLYTYSTVLPNCTRTVLWIPHQYTSHTVFDLRKK